MNFLDQKLASNNDENLQLNNFISTTNKNKVFNIQKYEIQLDEKETRVLSMICLLFSLNDH